MADLLGTYNPETTDIILTWAGNVHKVTGYTEGTFVEVERVLPSSTMYTGSDNSAFRIKRTNTASDITLTLHQASPSNTLLQALQKADERDPGNKYVFSIFIKDNAGQTKHFARQAFIGTIPNTSLGNEAEMRAWILHAVSMDSELGGNTLLDPALVQAIESLGVEVEAKWRE